MMYHFMIILVAMMIGVQGTSNQHLPTVSRNYSIGYGNFMIAQDWTLPTTDMFMTTYPQDTCSCYFSCAVHPECVASAAVWDGISTGPVECRLAKKGPLTSGDTAQQNHIYYFWEKTLPSADYFWTMNDHLAYMVIKEIKNFEDARDLCNSIPGHRLAIAKTMESVNALQQMRSDTGCELWIDLNKKEGSCSNYNVTYWGDSTPYNLDPSLLVCDRNQARKVRLDGNGIFNDKDGTGEYCPVCQANPYGHYW